MPWSVDDVRYESVPAGGIGILGPKGSLLAIVPRGAEDSVIAHEIVHRLNALEDLAAACRTPLPSGLPGTFADDLVTIAGIIAETEYYCVADRIRAKAGEIRAALEKLKGA